MPPHSSDVYKRQGEGAVLIDENGEEYMSEAPKGKVVNAVGAGDSKMCIRDRSSGLKQKNYKKQLSMMKSGVT